jgi:hypothetical protein
MKASDIEGRKIAKINQTRCPNPNGGKSVYNIDSMVLDNGTILVFTVHEGEGEYIIAATAHKRAEVNVHDE